VIGLPFANDVGQQVYLGYVVLVIALIGAWTRLRHLPVTSQNSASFWITTTLFFWLMTLGPQVRWLGHATPIPGPFALISLLPFFNGNRYPSRYSVMVLLGVTVLVGWGLRRLGDWEIGRLSVPSLQSLVSSLLLSSLLLFEHLAIPLPLQDMRVPGIYERLAAQPGAFALLELPTGWRNGARVLGKSDKLIMMQQWYQTGHGKRRLGGNTSRNPPYKFQYFSEAPLLGDLIALMNADQPHLLPVIDAELDSMIARNQPIAAQVLVDLGVQAITVHVEKSPPSLLRFVEEALPVTLIEEWQGVDWDGQPSTIRLYAVERPILTGERSIDLTDDTSALYLGAGWSVLPVDGVRYAVRPTATLLLPLSTEGGEVRLEMAAPSQVRAVALDQIPLTFTIADQALIVTIPPGLASASLDQLHLTFAEPGSPITALVTAPGGGWPIGTTGRALPADAAVLIRSAGEEVGDFAHVWVGGVDGAQGERGYNLVAFDETGAVQASAVFDTFASPDESTRLADWLAQWPPGTMVAGAVADEASFQLQPVAVDALQRIGVVGNLRGKFRWSHAFVGVVGADPGTAVEELSLIRPTTIAIGAGVEGTEVYGKVQRVMLRESSR